MDFSNEPSYEFTFLNLGKKTLREDYDYVNHVMRGFRIIYDPNNPHFKGVHGGFQVCHVCGRSTRRRCKNCRSIYYCNKTCQKTHWKEHRIECTKNISYCVINNNGEWQAMPTIC